MRYVIRLEGFVGRSHASAIAKALHRLWPEIHVAAAALPNKRRKSWRQKHQAVEPEPIKRRKRPVKVEEVITAEKIIGKRKVRDIQKESSPERTGELPK